jgi:hypothetical protein
MKSERQGEPQALPCWEALPKEAVISRECVRQLKVGLHDPSSGSLPTLAMALGVP